MIGNGLLTLPTHQAPFKLLLQSPYTALVSENTRCCRKHKQEKMGTVNIWLKRSYVGLTCFIMITCIVMCGFTLFHHGVMYKEEEIDNSSGASKGVHMFYVFYAASFLFSIFGLFGIFKKKTWPLIVFTVGIIICSLASLLVATVLMIGQSMFPHFIKDEYLGMLPLTNATETVTETLDHLQSEFECCGIDQGYKDWMGVIPHSCLCAEDATNPCVAAPRNSTLYEEENPVMIYAEPCLPIFLESVDGLIKGTIGLILGITILGCCQWSCVSSSCVK
ncbi:Tetraspanin-7 [Oryzias melastigma]|uniref:Tetraspanin-7 n=1 Tax=Oryzias melastigma TaxID=30732 RepID=A0A834BZ96_ORYME|nr:Tetraspanin-7 [Oryzias melastigma]